MDAEPVTPFSVMPPEAVRFVATCRPCREVPKVEALAAVMPPETPLSQVLSRVIDPGTFRALLTMISAPLERFL